MGGPSDRRAKQHRQAEIFLVMRLAATSMWLSLRGPKHWTWKKKLRPCVWVWFLSSLILTVVIQYISQAGTFSASLNVMIFIRTCPRLLGVSYRIWHHCPRYQLCLHMTKRNRVGHRYCSLFFFVLLRYFIYLIFLSFWRLKSFLLTCL